jgi:hypothetical protein
MRAILAGLFSFLGLLACVGVVFKYFPKGFGPAWLMGIFFAMILCVLMGISLVAFNRKGMKPSLYSKSEEARIGDLEKAGLLVPKTFRAKRAFQVDEFEDEGIHYFIELDDGGTLFLTGQYLYDYERIEDDPEVNQSRKFPCTEFTIRRHKEAGYVVQILCGGQVIEPEFIAPPFDKSDWKRGIPEDGAILRNKSYDELKRERKGE